MDPQLKLQLKQVVAIASPASVDLAGQVLTGTPATFWARVEPRYREVNVNGVLEKTTHFVVLDESAGSISEANFRAVQIWLPNDTLGATDTVRRPRVTHFCYDENGLLGHVELWV